MTANELQEQLQRAGYFCRQTQTSAGQTALTCGHYRAKSLGGVFSMIAEPTGWLVEFYSGRLYSIDPSSDLLKFATEMLSISNGIPVGVPPGVMKTYGVRQVN